MFHQEIREKKRTANGVHSKTGLKGYVGKMLMPTDFMSRKEKRAYTQTKEMRSYNMYEEIMSYVDFIELNRDTQKELLERYRSIFNNRDIAQKWRETGMKGGTTRYYEIVNGFGIKLRANHKKEKVVKKSATNNIEIPLNNNEIIEQLKQNMNYEKFKKLSTKEKYEVFLYYENHFPNLKDMADLWEISDKTLSSQRYRLNVWQNENVEVAKIISDKIKNQENKIEKSKIVKTEIAKPSVKIIENPTEELPSTNEFIPTESSTTTYEPTKPTNNEFTSTTDFNVNFNKSYNTTNPNNGKSIYVKTSPYENNETLPVYEKEDNTKEDDFAITYNGEYTNKKIAKRLRQIANLLEDESISTYGVKLSIKEKEEIEELEVVVSKEQIDEEKQGEIKPQQPQQSNAQQMLVELLKIIGENNEFK